MAVSALSGKEFTKERVRILDSFSLVTLTFLDDSTFVVRAIVGHPGLNDFDCKLNI